MRRVSSNLHCNVSKTILERTQYIIHKHTIMPKSEFIQYRQAINIENRGYKIKSMIDLEYTENKISIPRVHVLVNNEMYKQLSTDTLENLLYEDYLYGFYVVNAGLRIGNEYLIEPSIYIVNNCEVQLDMYDEFIDGLINLEFIKHSQD